MMAISGWAHLMGGDHRHAGDRADGREHKGPDHPGERQVRLIEQPAANSADEKGDRQAEGPGATRQGLAAAAGPSALGPGHGRNCSRRMRSSRLCSGSNSSESVMSAACRIVTAATSRTSVESATALTGRFAGSRISKVTVALSGSRAPRQRRGRKALIGVRASNRAPIGMIGPCAGQIVGRAAGRRRDQGAVARQLGQPLDIVDKNAQLRGLVGLAQQRHLVDRDGFDRPAVDGPRLHQQRMDIDPLGCLQPFGQAFRSNSFIRKPTLPQVHAIDGDIAAQRRAQGLQHEPVAAEGDDAAGLRRRHGGIAGLQVRRAPPVRLDVSSAAIEIGGTAIGSACRGGPEPAGRAATGFRFKTWPKCRLPSNGCSPALQRAHDRPALLQPSPGGDPFALPALPVGQGEWRSSRTAMIARRPAE